MGIVTENKRLEESDKRFIWHPFTQMREWLDERPVMISEGRDCFLKDIYGNWYLDGVSSLWVNIHGHRKKEIDHAITGQLEKIGHSTMLGLSNVPAIELAERLIRLLNPPLAPCPSPLKKVFYSDNGSTAVEVALKMAFQYWIHKGSKGKSAFLSLKNAYHGDTLGAVSVGGIDIFHNTFGPLLFKTYKAPSPYCYRCELGATYPDCGLACLRRMEEALSDHSSEIAAVILEPLVQAAGGMIVAPAGYLKGVRQLCDTYGVLMIADEVATGFGRTGRMFACEHEGVMPDILCISKGITGGYMPLAATIATEEVYGAFLGEFGEVKTFFHGHSYTGNPLGCAAALACLEIFEREKTIERLGPKMRMLEVYLKDLSELTHVGDVRNRGMMAGIELVRDKSTKEPYLWEEKMGWRVADYAKAHGVFIRPLGNVVVIMPPLSISLENLERLLMVVREGIESATG
ncbi:MAG TPA: adenosylmethionine--8-amino-7-oxononanoate transaminase [Thermodesulfovibrionales bacterium]|nr:adenosylmethionine--8-amino-7-oxononanoate transaminase [Thermodesulfovibrionales bacterium]